MIEVKETMFRQPSMGWCSVYSIANMVNDNSALKYLDKQDFKGCDDKQENEVLKHIFDDSYQLINIAYSSQQHASFPASYVWDVLTCDFIKSEAVVFNAEICITPFLLTVKLYSFIDIWHRVYVFVNNGEVYYSDPYKEQILKLQSCDDFKELFHVCQSIDRIGLTMDGELKFALLIGENLRYNWLIEEPIICL